MKEELKHKSREELRLRLQESQKELLKLRVQLSAGTASSSGKIRGTRKNIARILTLLAQKEVKKQ